MPEMDPGLKFLSSIKTSWELSQPRRDSSSAIPEEESNQHCQEILIELLTFRAFAQFASYKRGQGDVHIAGVDIIFLLVRLGWLLFTSVLCPGIVDA